MAAGSNMVEHKLRLLIETQLDEKQKQQVGKQLHDILGSAAIGFDEAETKKNITPIIRMLQKLFDKAEMKFDADKLLGMPSQQALQKVADITAEEFQTAFDRALAKSGGIKIDFGNIDLSAMTEPLERVTEELVEINRKIANETKKSVDDIGLAIQRLNKIKPKKVTTKVVEDGVEKEATQEITKVEQTVTAIEKTLNAVNSPKALTTEKGAIKALEKARLKYEESIKNGDAWEVQYQHMVNFVSKYEAMTKKIKPLVDTSHSEFKELYDVLSPKAGAAKISLEHFVDVARGNELSEYKNQPWARESTLKKIEQTLKNGISVKGDGEDKKSEGLSKEFSKPIETPVPSKIDGEDKKPNTKAPIGNSKKEKKTKEVTRTEKFVKQMEALNNLEGDSYDNIRKKQVELEKILKTLKEEKLLTEEIQSKYDLIKLSLSDRLAQSERNLTGRQKLVADVSKDAMGRTFRSWDEVGFKNQESLIRQALEAHIPAFSQMGEDDQEDLIFAIQDFSNNAIGIENAAKSFESIPKTLEEIYESLDSEFQKIIRRYAEVEDEGEDESFDLADQILGRDESIDERIRRDKDDEWTKLKNKLLGQASEEAERKQGADEASLKATQNELKAEEKITTEIEKQNKLLLYRRVEGDLDPNRISSRSTDALYDKTGKPIIQEALEYGFGGFGDGLYAATLSGAESLATTEGKTTFFEFDASDYNLYINKTVEQAKALRTFLLSLQKLVGSGTILDDAELTDIESLSEKELFAMAQELFSNFNMTTEQFYAWIRGAKEESAKIAELFAQGKVPEDRHNFGTRFMKSLGYEGVLNITGDEDYDGNYQGSVIYDPNIDKIKESMVAFETTKEYLDYIGVAAQNAESAIEALNEDFKEKEVIESTDNNGAEAAETKTQTEAINQQNEALKENIALKTQASAAASVEHPLGDSVEVKASVDTEELRNLLSAITYNVKVIQDAEPVEDNKVSIDEAALKNVLNSLIYNVKIAYDDADKQANKIAIDEGVLKNVLQNIVYNVKLAHDDNDKEANKIAIDEKTLESTLHRVFANTLNSDAEDGDVKNESWALENTLQSVKSVLDQIQANTAKPESVEIVPTNTEVGHALATETTLSAIKTTVEKINGKIVKDTKNSGGSNRKSGRRKKNAEDYAGSQYFPEKIKTQTMYLAKFRAQLMTTGRLTDEVDAQIYELVDGLKQVKNGPDLSKWNQQFLQLKTSVGIEDIFEKAEDKISTASYEELIESIKTRNKLELQYEKAQEGTPLKQFYADQLAQMDSVIAKQEEILENEEYEAKLTKMRTEQERKLGEAEAKAATKDAKKTATSAKKLAQREAMLGKAGSAVGRAETTWMSAVGIDGELPAGFVADIDEYYQKIEALRKKHQELKDSDLISEEQKKELIDQTMEINKMTSEIGELVSEYQRLSGDNTKVIGTNTLGTDAGLNAYEQQMKQAVMTATNGKAQIKNFDAATKTLTYTVKTGKNEFTEYTAAVRRADGALVAVQETTKRTETFFEATARKMKELTSYFSGMAVFNRIGQELRRGIQYIREIDIALTELKKVTDETEETYDEFLKTAAKTGARLGTTISAVTEATATFAKLGYSMKQATEMAEAAIVYKNVGDNIESTGDAADSIISTLKGFGMEASEAMAIVDRFNEVGNRFAITSQGIGEALRLSASALNEGGNSLDESIAMITAANEVVNDPSSVGKNKLADIKSGYISQNPEVDKT